MISIRQPIELNMIDSKSCTTCVTAQLLYMFGKLEQPIDLAQIDERIGRSPNEFCLNGGYFLELLRQQFTLTSIADVDLESAYGVDGLAYLHEYYADEPQLAELLTPEYYQEWRARGLAYQQYADSLPGKRFTVIEKPHADHVTWLLEKMPAVIVPLKSGVSIFSHLVIAYGLTPAKDILAYHPSLEGTTLRTFSPIELQRTLVPGETIVGVSL